MYRKFAGPRRKSIGYIHIRASHEITPLFSSNTFPRARVHLSCMIKYIAPETDYSLSLSVLRGPVRLSTVFREIRRYRPTYPDGTAVFYHGSTETAFGTARMCALGATFPTTRNRPGGFGARTLAFRRFWTRQIHFRAIPIVCACVRAHIAEYSICNSALRTGGPTHRSAANNGSRAGATFPPGRITQYT